MSKRSRRSDRISRPERDAPAIATPQVRRADVIDYYRRAARRTLIEAYQESLPDIEDRRTYYPDPVGAREAVYRPLKPLRGTRTRYAPRNVNLGRSRPPARPSWGLAVWHQPVFGFNIPTRIAFERPRDVSICMRRAIRRAVLHATGVAGRSPRNFKRRRRGEWSSIGC